LCLNGVGILETSNLLAGQGLPGKDTNEANSFYVRIEALDWNGCGPDRLLW
jgi:hypothetical protein